MMLGDASDREPPRTSLAGVMCGIAGVLRTAGAIDSGPLARSSQMLTHRGPDDHGFLGWHDGQGVRSGREPAVVAGARLGLAHRRLSILDLTTAGRQPMSSADGTLHLVYNGEIYNFRELRRELQTLGHSFVSSGDTEVLLAAYTEWGLAALDRVIGMFAFAVLDLRARALVLARDHFGIKPLYYQVLEGGFAFASEVGALLELSGQRPVVDPVALYHYLRFGLTDHGPATLVRGVCQLPAAHHLTVPLDTTPSPTPLRFWDPRPDARVELSFNEAASRLRELLLESVGLHLRSDVPVGAALSGGIDSSSIVMLMRHLAGNGLELHTVSYDAEDPELGERRWIEITGHAASARQHLVAAQPQHLVEDLERLMEAQYEPFISTSIYAQYCVFRAAAAAGLKVMLDGQGADELLGGYRHHLAARLVSLLRRGQLAAAARLWRRSRRLPGVADSDLLAWLGFHVLPELLHGAARRLAGRPLVPAWLDAGWLSQCPATVSPLHRSSTPAALGEVLVASLERTSLPMLLRYEDRDSMAFSIESRVPFLTPQLADFMLALPEHYIIDDSGTGKAVLRAAMRGLVPDEVLDRRDKVGFATPEQRWLVELTPWVEQVLSSEAALAIPALSHSGLLQEWHAVATGRRRFDSHIWRCLNLIRWVERCSVRFED